MSDRAPSPTEPSRGLKEPGRTLSEGDLRDDSSELAGQIEGCRWAVHCAARVYSGKDWSAVQAVNVDGTQSTLEAAARAGVRHGRACVIGRGVRTDVRSGDFYGRSKRLAEEAAAGMHESGRMQVTIVRPSAVYGERDRRFAPTLARILRLPVVPVMGHGDNTVPVVYAGNVAAGVASALDGKGSGSAFNLALDYPLTQRELLDGLARGLGRSPTFICLPAALVRAVASVADGVSFMVPGLRGLSGARVTRLGLGENPYPSQREREWLGWRPSVPQNGAVPTPPPRQRGN